MFGFVVANIADITDQEKDRYRAFYCGLCHTLKNRHGQISRVCLSYDLAFITMLFGSLYEPEEKTSSLRCPLHPLESQTIITTTYSDYAADMTIALAYHKCLDDWNDEHKLSAKTYNALLSNAYRNVERFWPRQCAAITEGLRLIEKIEARSTHELETDPDQAGKIFGSIMGEILVYNEDDLWAEALRQFGAYLGRFIYFMDAAVDLDEDREHHRYNPFGMIDAQPKAMQEMLMQFIGEATHVFEMLPLEKDLHTMRSVLYAGVWQQFYKRYDSHTDTP